jgi:hypothetical protein
LFGLFAEFGGGFAQNEKGVIYRVSYLFAGGERREVHAGGKALDPGNAVPRTTYYVRGSEAAGGIFRRHG